MAALDIESKQRGELQDDHFTLSDIHEILKDLQKAMKTVSNEVEELKLSLKNEETDLGAIEEYPAHSFTFAGSLCRTRQITIGTILIQ